MTDLALAADQPADRPAAAAAPVPEPPGGGVVPTLLDRVAGAFLAVAVVEDRVTALADRLAALGHGSRRRRNWFGGFPVQGSALDTLLASAAAYSSDPHKTPAEAFPPVWVLPAAVTYPDAVDRLAAVDELAQAGEVDPTWVPACGAYSALAADVLAGLFRPVAHSSPAGLRLDSDRVDRVISDHPDAANLISVWAVMQPAPLLTILRALAPTCGFATLAAVAGVVGLRDGLGGLPADTYRSSLARHQRCIAVAQALVRARRTRETETADRP